VKSRQPRTAFSVYAWFYGRRQEGAREEGANLSEKSSNKRI
jgi:hypothetical protein